MYFQEPHSSSGAGWGRVSTGKSPITLKALAAAYRFVTKMATKSLNYDEDGVQKFQLSHSYKIGH